MLWKGVRYKIRVLGRAMIDWYVFMRRTWPFATIIAAAIALLAHYQAFGGPSFEDYTNGVVSGLIGIAVVAGGVFLWMLFWAPFKIEQDLVGSHEVELKEILEEKVTLEGELEKAREDLDGKNRMRECAVELELLIMEGQNLLHNYKKDLELPGREWRRRVLTVLRKYWPTAASGFNIMHGRHPSGEWRKMLQEELDKLDGYMITLRNVV